MKPATFFGTGILSVMAACAPMEQAPLVYASSQQFGVQVTAGAPESPGFSVNIGYKGLDAAFVPVAVAKYCGNSPASDCQNDIYALTPVMGNNNRGGSASIDERMLARIEDRIQQTRDAISREDAEIAAAERRKKANEADVAREPALADEKATLEAAEPDQNGTSPRAVRIGEIDAELKKIADLPTTESLDQAIQNRQARIETLRTALKDDENLANQIRMSRNAESTDKKGDAYSVYGSFDGGANGDRNGASLKLGKVFSTGIAAQNLTQGLQKASVISAQAECLSKITEHANMITDHGKRDQYLADTHEMCLSHELIDYQ